MTRRRRKHKQPKPPPPALPFPRRARILYVLAALAFGLAIYGCSLPWYHVNKLAFHGTDFAEARLLLPESAWTLGSAALGIVICALCAGGGLSAWWPAAPCTIGVLVGPAWMYQRRIYEPVNTLREILDQIGQELPLDRASISLGAGFWTVSGAAVAALLLMLLAHRAARSSVA